MTLTIVCSRHPNTELDFTIDYMNRIKVDSCPDCAEEDNELEDSRIQNGYDDGYRHGYDDGLEAGRGEAGG